MKLPILACRVWLACLAVPGGLLAPGAGVPEARAVGTLIPAPSRYDMVHDAARDVLYITSGSQVLRYRLEAGDFLPAIQLSGSLGGVDLSPDGNTLAVANRTRTGELVRIHLVHLETDEVEDVTFTRGFGEGGTYTVAFGGDGAVLISGTYEGSGWVPLRRYDPATGETRTIRTVSQGTMLTASGDGTAIALAEGNSSGGPTGWYDVRDQAVVRTGGTSWFNFEIGISRDGMQMAVPTYGGTFVYDPTFFRLATIGTYASGQPIGVVYHPSADVVFFPWATTSEVRAYDTVTLQPIASFNFEHAFTHTGNAAFGQGRMKISRDGAIIFCTVNGGVRYLRHGLTVPRYHRLVVLGNPRQIGMPTPAGYGTNWLAENSAWTQQAPAEAELEGVRYRCTGWSGTGSVPADGAANSVSFTLAANSTLTWNWTPTAYQLTVAAAGPGVVDNPGGWHAAGADVVMTATPAQGFQFARWIGDVSVEAATDNPLIVTMDQARRVTALFVPEGGDQAYLPGDWPTFGRGPSHEGYVAGILGTASFTPRWSLAEGGYYQVAVAMNRVYQARGSALEALDTASGAVLWSHPFAAGSLNPPTYHEGAVYIQRGNHGSDTQLWSIDADTGQTRWSAPHSAQWESYLAPTVAEDSVWINGGYYGGIYGFNRTSGAQLFFLDLEQYDEWTPLYHAGRVFSWVEGRFREHNPRSGTVLWTLDRGWDWRGWSMNRTVAAANGRAFAVGNPNLHAIDLDGRKLAWEAAGNFIGTPAVANGVVYAISNQTICAFTAHEGQFVGQYAASESLRTQPIVTDDVLIAASDSTTFVFDLATFELRQTLAEGGELSLADGVLYVSGAGRLHAYSTGQDVPLIIMGTPVAIGGPAVNAYGTNLLPRGTVVTNSVLSVVETNRSRYRCQGWTGTGSVPASGTANRVTFNLEEASTLTWHWEATAFQLVAGAAGRGSVNFSNGWITAGSAVTLNATPQPEYRFVKWVGELPAGQETANPLTLTMDQPRRVTAVFAPVGGPPLTGEWPMFGNGPAHSGYFQGVLGDATFRERWQVAVGGSLQQAAVGGSRIYVTPWQYFGTAFLAAYHEYSGQLVWRRDFASAYSINPPTYDRGAVYMQRGNHASDTHLWSFNAADGATNWLAPHAAQWERYMSPTVADGSVWVNGGSYGGLYGFNQTNGAQNFFTNLEQYDGWTPCHHNGRLYTFVASKFREHHPRTGTTLWTLAVDASSSYGDTKTVVAADGRAYVFTTGGYGTNGAGLVAIDLATRSVAWRVRGSFTGWPAAANGIVYAVSNTAVTAYSEQGQFIGQFAAPSPLSGQPIVTDDALIIAGQSGTYIFDLATQGLRQTISAIGNPSLANGVLIVAGADQLAAYSSTDDLQVVMQSDGGRFGNPTPLMYGTNLVPAGTPFATGVTSPWPGAAGTRYVNRGWTGTGSVPAAGASNLVNFTLAVDSSLTWLWKTQHYLNVVVVSNGTVSIDDGWFDVGSTVNLTATPSNYFHFVSWGGDAAGTSPTTAITMAGPRTAIAYFAADLVTNSVPVWWLAQHGLGLDDAGALADNDADGLPNWREYALGTHPRQVDTDADGYGDGLEVVWSANPLNAQSVPRAALVIAGNPAPIGAPTPLGYGTNLVPLFQNVSNRVSSPVPIAGTGGQRLWATGWTGTGSVPPSGTGSSVSFQLATNSVLTWHWITQFLLTNQVQGAGSISAVREIRENGVLLGTETSPDGWWASNTTVVLTATPWPYFRFDHWGGSITGNAERVELVMTAPRSTLAVFVARTVAFNTPEWWLAANGLPVSDAGALADTDGDGLANWAEYANATYPRDADTDDDGYTDADEVTWRSQPADPSSIPQVSLTIAGEPWAPDVSEPYGYGQHQLALYSEITVGVSPVENESYGERFVNTGWTGTGSVPASGNTHRLELTLTTNSTLRWNWRREFLLTESVSLGLPSRDPIREEQFIALAGDGAADDYFGWSVAIDGEYAIVGAPLNVGKGLNSGTAQGAAYVYRRAGGQWSPVAKLTAADSIAYNFFGCAVAMSGDVAVIGAYGNTDFSRPYCTAYVHRRIGTNWAFEAKLNTTQPALNWDQCAVAVDGDAVVIGANADAGRGTMAGAALVFRRSPSGTWNVETKLNAVDSKANQNFGTSVSIRGDRVVVGAPGDTVGRRFAGAAYVFRRLGGSSWTQEAKLAPAQLAAFADFGNAVALSSNTVVVGARFDEVNAIPSGAAYVFGLVSGDAGTPNPPPPSWALQARLAPEAPSTFSGFGQSVAVRGDQVIVGVPSDSASGIESGSAWLFARSGTNWGRSAHLLAAQGQAADTLGASVAIDGSFAIVGAPANDTLANDAGAAAVFDLTRPETSGTKTWWPTGTPGRTTAATPAMTASGQVWQFVGWELDGVPWRDADHAPVNPLTGIPMNTWHEAVAVYLPAASDADGDGLPDWWEEAYLGGLTQGASGDADGDKQSNWSEWRAGTNPASRASLFKLDGWIDSSTGSPQIALQWPSATGRTYRILFAADLNGSPGVIATNVPATPPVNVFRHAISGRAQGFYRVAVE